MIQKYGARFDQELWDRIAEEETQREIHNVGVKRDPKFLRAASQGSSSTFRSYALVVPPNEVCLFSYYNL